MDTMPIAVVSEERLREYDESLKDKFFRPIGPVELNIQAGNWIGDVSPFTQEISVEGITAEMENLTLNPINILDEAARTEYEAAICCMLPAAETANDKVILKAHTKPEIDFKMILKGVRF